MHCVKPILITKGLDRLRYPDGLEVPCGKCLECRISKRREWSLRLIHELDAWDNQAVFVTLTYQDDYLPENMSLRKTDLQKFFKRIRKGLTNGRKIKYYACGEYGNPSRTIRPGQVTVGERPHYHAIIYGLYINDVGYIQEKWPFGQIHTGSVTPDSIRYVCQYIDKKFTGEQAEIEYVQKSREPVFKLSSNGLGKTHVLENSEQYLQNEYITLNGIKQTFPRYYLKLLDLEKSDFRMLNALDKDKELVRKFTGVNDKTFIDFYKTQSVDKVVSLIESIRQERLQHCKNSQAKIDLFTKD